MVQHSRLRHQVVAPIMEALVCLAVIGGLTWVALRIWVAVVELVEAHAR